jgi:tetratricopeptide (TPR) repeat protein
MKRKSQTKQDRERRRLPLDFDALFPLVYVVLYAVALFIVYRLYFLVGDTGVESDFYGDMGVAARELWRGNFSVTYYQYKGPVYPFVLTFFFALIGDWYRSGVVLNIVFSAAGIVFLYRLIRAIFNRPVAVFTVVSVSLVFEFFLVAHKASSDMLFFFLFVLVLERIVTDRLSWFRLCGAAIASALAFLTRYSGVFLPVGVVGTLLAINPGTLTIKRRSLFAAVYVIIFLAVCAPWFIANYTETHTMLSTRNLENIVEEFYSERDVPESGFSSMSDVFSHDPIYFITHYLVNIPRHFWKDINGTIGIEAGVLVLLGILRLFVFPPSRRQYSFFLFACLYFLLLCFIFHLRRFSIPLTPAYYVIGFSLLFTSGVAEITGPGRVLRHAFNPQIQRIRVMWSKTLWGNPRSATGSTVGARSRSGGKKRERKRASPDMKTSPVEQTVSTSRFVITVGHGLFFLLIAVLIVFQVKRIAKFERMYYVRRPLFVLPAAQFLRQPAYRLRDGKKPVLMARKPHVAFYADMKFQYYPKFFHSLPDFIAFAMGRDVDYIVYSTIEKEHYPEAEFLVRLDRTPGIEMIYHTEKIYIYRIADWVDMSTGAGLELLEKYKAALREAETAGNVDRIISECYNLSGMYGVNGDWEKMAEYLIRALRAVDALAESSSRTKHTILLKINISEAYFLSGNHQKGIDILEEIIPTIAQHGTREQLTSVHIILSKHYEQLEWWEDAKKHLSIVRDLYVLQGNTAKAEHALKAIERVERRIQ